MQYQQERLNSFKDEIKPLIEKHWEEIALNQDTIKLNPDWDTYYKLEAMGFFKAYTARVDGKLVGYFTIIATKGLHYADHVFAATDIIYISPEYRKGRAGYGLIKFAEQQLKKDGVSILAINTKDHAPFDKLLQGMGYDLAERLYQKYIGE